jgi:hypothetical protein
MDDNIKVSDIIVSDNITITSHMDEVVAIASKPKVEVEVEVTEEANEEKTEEK